MNLLLVAILSKEILLGDLPKMKKKTLEALWGYRIFGQKLEGYRIPKERIIGIWDIKYGDIQRELQGYETTQLKGCGILEKNLKGVRDTQTPPPPLNGASLFGDLLKRKKNPRGVEEEGKELALFLLFGL